MSGDSDLQQKIEQELAWQPSVDARHAGSKAILSGSVRSWSEKHQAEAATWAAPGIAAVENNIVITS